jgi:ubiquinone biosynthesis protein
LWNTAKPFLENWMNRQVGWAALVEGFQREAPRYAQLLPELPRLIHQALQPRPAAEQRTLEQLLVEQRRTNRLLVSILYAAAGVLLGLLAAQWLLR